MPHVPLRSLRLYTGAVFAVVLSSEIIEQEEMISAEYPAL
jgi:hypothetical protein